MRLGISLNDIMYTGPKLQPEIQVVLLCAYLWKHVFTADAKLISRQIMVHPYNQDYLKIFWCFSQQLQSMNIISVQFYMELLQLRSNLFVNVARTGNHKWCILAVSSGYSQRHIRRWRIHWCSYWPRCTWWWKLVKLLSLGQQ